MGIYIHNYKYYWIISGVLGLEKLFLSRSHSKSSDIRLKALTNVRPSSQLNQFIPRHFPWGKNTTPSITPRKLWEPQSTCIRPDSREQVAAWRISVWSHDILVEDKETYQAEATSTVSWAAIGFAREPDANLNG